MYVYSVDLTSMFILIYSLLLGLPAKFKGVLHRTSLLHHFTTLDITGMQGDITVMSPPSANRKQAFQFAQFLLAAGGDINGMQGDYTVMSLDDTGMSGDVK